MGTQRAPQHAQPALPGAQRHAAQVSAHVCVCVCVCVCVSVCACTRAGTGAALLKAGMSGQGGGAVTGMGELAPPHRPAACSPSALHPTSLPLLPLLPPLLSTVYHSLN